MWLEVQYFLFFWVVSVDTWKVLRTSSQLSPQSRAGPQTAVDQCQCLSSISLKWTVVHSLKDSLISSLYESLSLHFILPLACFLSVLSYMSPLSLSLASSTSLSAHFCQNYCLRLAVLMRVRPSVFLSLCRPLLLCCAAIVRRLMRASVDRTERQLEPQTREEGNSRLMTLYSQTEIWILSFCQIYKDAHVFAWFSKSVTAQSSFQHKRGGRHVRLYTDDQWSIKRAVMHRMYAS